MVVGGDTGEGSVSGGRVYVGTGPPAVVALVILGVEGTDVMVTAVESRTTNVPARTDAELASSRGLPPG